MSIRSVVAVLALAAALAGCRDSSANRPIEMKTLESGETRLRTVKQAPSLDATTPEGTTQGNEEPRQLPFAPTVAMDPVDGSKVVISQKTPTADYKDRTYYFSSEGTKATFLADPGHYSRGR